MSTGFEALPPRESGRLAKRRRMEGAAASSAPRSGSEGAASAQATESESSAATASDLLYSGPETAASTSFEYLDHTADVQLHSWGVTLGEAFCQTALAMFTYMTEPGALRVDPACSRIIEARGHDVITLLFQFLDQCLFAFASEDFMACDMRVVSLRVPGDPSVTQMGSSLTPESESAPRGSRADCFIRVAAFGERFVVGKHPQGTEIKAITYSNMQIRTPAKLYSANDALEAAAAVDEVAASAGPAVGGAGGDASLEGAARDVKDGSEPSAAGRAAPFEIFVIVDI